MGQGNSQRQKATQKSKGKEIAHLASQHKNPSVYGGFLFKAKTYLFIRNINIYPFIIGVGF